MCKGGIVLPQPLRGSTYSIQIISHVISRPLVGPPPMCHGIPDGFLQKKDLVWRIWILDVEFCNPAASTTVPQHMSLEHVTLRQRTGGRTVRLDLPAVNGARCIGGGSILTIP